MARVPYLLVASARERDNRTVALRTRDGQDLGVLPIEQALAKLPQEAQAPDFAARIEAQQRLRDSLTGESAVVS